MIYGVTTIKEQLQRGDPLSEVLREVTAEDIFTLLVEYPETFEALGRRAAEFQSWLRRVKPFVKLHQSGYSSRQSLDGALARVDAETLRPIRPELAAHLVANTYKDLDPRADDLAMELLSQADRSSSIGAVGQWREEF